MNGDEAVTDPSRLDDVDFQILRILRLDARQSARSLAREIGMSPGAVTERLSRLENAGVIRGYHADVDPVALGYRMRVIVSIALKADADQQVVRDYLLEMKEVIAAYFVTGRWDLVVLARVRTQEHLRQAVIEHVRRCPGFKKSETMLVLERHAPGAQSAIAHDLELDQ
jgi:DNA-binding Lrp family transcriptional regulator